MSSHNSVTHEDQGGCDAEPELLMSRQCPLVTARSTGSRDGEKRGSGVVKVVCECPQMVDQNGLKEGEGFLLNGTKMKNIFNWVKDISV